jgi:DNA (cytosine-5)-methyltransferase 1
MKILDLFCGVGGSTLGAKLAGATVTDAYDWDKVALENYHRNHPEVRTHKTNILYLSAQDLPAGADVLMGSTPCEKFSIANRWDRTEDMTMTNHFLKIVEEYKPRFWVLENVPPVRRFLLDRLPEDQLRILLASDYGVPQGRKRPGGPIPASRSICCPPPSRSPRSGTSTGRVTTSFPSRP